MSNTNLFCNLIAKRQRNIINLLKYFVPTVIARIIGDYDYYIEGKAYTIANVISPIDYVTILPDERIACGLRNGTINIWNPKTGLCDITFNESTRFVHHVAVIINKKGIRLISESNNNTLIIRNLQTKICDITFSIHSDAIKCIGILPERIVSSSYDTTIKVWHSTTGKCDIVLNNSCVVNCIAIFPDGRVAIGSDRTIKIWNIETGKCDVIFTEDTHLIHGIKVLSAEKILIHGIKVLSAEKFLSGFSDTTLKIWNLKNNICENTIEEHNYSIKDIAVLPDGRIVTCSESGIFKIWNLQTMKCDVTFNDQSGNVSHVGILPDGRIVSSSNSTNKTNTLKIWS
jgi:WD40 repeat protein